MGMDVGSDPEEGGLREGQSGAGVGPLPRVRKPGIPEKLMLPGKQTTDPTDYTDLGRLSVIGGIYRVRTNVS
jgi:hypothetical protein